MRLEVGETEDCLAGAGCKEKGCGWRQEKQRTVWWTPYIRSQDVAVGRRDRVLFGRRNLSGATMWVEVGETGIVWWGKVLEERVWLEVGTTQDIMVEAMCTEQGCGWK